MRKRRTQTGNPGWTTSGDLGWECSPACRGISLLEDVPELAREENPDLPRSTWILFFSRTRFHPETESHLSPQRIDCYRSLGIVPRWSFHIRLQGQNRSRLPIDVNTSHQPAVILQEVVSARVASAARFAGASIVNTAPVGHVLNSQYSRG